MQHVCEIQTRINNDFLKLVRYTWKNYQLVDDKKSEFKWIEVDKVYDDKVVGHLEKDSVYLPNVKAGMAVTVPVADIEDWAFVDAQGKQHGGASQAILQKRAQK